MAYSAAALFALASQCAPSVAPETVLAIIQTESSGEPFTLSANGSPLLSVWMIASTVSGATLGAHRSEEHTSELQSRQSSRMPSSA